MKERQVEKLTPDMVGMEMFRIITGDIFEFTVLYVGEQKALIRNKNNVEDWTWVSGTYTIRYPKEKEKLPRERLAPIRIDSIWTSELCDILDEHHKRLIELEARK